MRTLGPKLHDFYMNNYSWIWLLKGFKTTSLVYLSLQEVLAWFSVVSCCLLILSTFNLYYSLFLSFLCSEINTWLHTAVICTRAFPELTWHPEPAYWFGGGWGEVSVLVLCRLSLKHPSLLKLKCPIVEDTLTWRDSCEEVMAFCSLNQVYIKNAAATVSCLEMEITIWWCLQLQDHCEWGFTCFAMHPWYWCSVSKQIVSWPPCCLFSVRWILQAAVLSLPCLSCGQVLAPRPAQTPSNFSLQTQHRKLFVNAIQGLFVLHHFSHSLLMVFHLSQVFLHSQTMGKGFDLVSYQ